MDNLEYKKIVEKNKPEENKLLNLVISFLVGGFVGLLANFSMDVYAYYFHLSTKDASSYMLITFIFVASFLTAVLYIETIFPPVIFKVPFAKL